MLIIHGTYHFLPKTTAFRNDYCLACAAPRRSFRIRTFDVLHVFWIPLLPVGLWSRWHCSACGGDPHVSGKTRRSFKIAGLVLLALFAVLFWIVPIEPGEEATFWVLRFAAPIGAILTFRHLRSAPPDTNLARELTRIPPASDMSCPGCSTPLVRSADWYCPQCGMKRM